jgi:tryptophanyl-tRNA synthetase
MESTMTNTLSTGRLATTNDTATDSVVDTASAARSGQRRPAVVHDLAEGIALAGPERPARVLSGDRPTGPLHLGHYLGTLRNRVALQRAGTDLIVVIADYQVITDRVGVGPLRQRTRDIVADYLACGIDPDTAVIFPHSAVAELHQLMLPFLSLVTDAELRRNPTVKAEREDSGRPLSGLLLTYPVHQAADILFCHSDLVPVGQDQLPHIELTRAIARRFNQQYGPVFTEPSALLSEVPLLLGTDGTKMSKSRGNTVMLGATEDQTAAVIRSAVTDSQRQISYEPERRPGVSALLDMAARCLDVSPETLATDIGGGGAARLKQVTTEAVNDHLRPIRRRRAELLADPAQLDGVLVDGIAAATAIARHTLMDVRAAMGMDYLAEPPLV